MLVWKGWNDVDKYAALVGQQGPSSWDDRLICRIQIPNICRYAVPGILDRVEERLCHGSPDSFMTGHSLALARSDLKASDAVTVRGTGGDALLAVCKHTGSPITRHSRLTWLTLRSCAGRSPRSLMKDS